MPVSYRQPFLRTLPNKYLQQLFATWGAKGLIGGNVSWFNGASSGTDTGPADVTNAVFMNAFFNCYLLPQGSVSQYGGPFIMPNAVPIDSNGWPTGAHNYSMAQYATLPAGALSTAVPGRIPAGNYYVYFTSTGTTATTISITDGAGGGGYGGVTIGSPTVTGSSGAWVSVYPVTFTGSVGAYAGLCFSGGAQNECMPLDGTNPLTVTGYASPAAYVASVINKNGSNFCWPVALASLSTYNCWRDMGPSGGSSNFYPLFTGPTQTSWTNRSLPLANVAAEYCPQPCNGGNRYWSEETSIGVWNAIYNYSGSLFKHPWHNWGCLTDTTTYPTGLANLLNSNLSNPSIAVYHEITDETWNGQYGGPSFGWANAVLQSKAVTNGGTARGAIFFSNPICTYYSIDATGKIVTYTPTAYPIVVGDLVTFGAYNQGYIAVATGPTSIGGGQYQVTFATAFTPNQVGYFGFNCTALITNVTGNGTTASVTVRALPTFLVSGNSYSMLAADTFAATTGGGYSTATAVTATVSGTGPYTITYPSTFTGAVGQGLSYATFQMYFNPTDPIVTTQAGSSAGYYYINNMTYAFYVIKLYAFYNVFKTLRPQDRFLVNCGSANTSPSNALAAPNFQYVGGITEELRVAAVLSGTDASWLSCAIQPYYGATDPFLSTDGVVVNCTLAAANSTTLSFTTSTLTVAPGMQVTGSLITGTVNVGQVPGGGAHTGAGGHTLLPLSAVTLVYGTGASSTAGTANLTFSNKFQGYVTQVTINGSSKSVFVWTGGAYITYGTCFAAGTYGGVAIPAGVCMGHGVFGTPFSGGSGATDNVHTSGAAFVLSQTVANIGSAGAPVTFTPYQPTGTYTTDSPYIVSTYANCFAANYLRELRFISQCAYYKAEPLAYEGGLSNAYGTVLPAGPGAGVPGYYWPFIVSDSNMYKSTVQQYLDWFQLGGSIFCPINTGVGPVAQDAYFLGGGGGWYGNQGWQDTTSVAAKGAIQTDATAITYDPMFGVTTGGTVTQSFPTSYAYTVGMASNSTQVAPQQPLATDMMYGTTGSFVDTYWVIGATQLYTLTVSGSDSAAATCNVYIAAISGNTLLNTGGALSIPVNGAGNTPATVPGNTSSFTHTFTAGNYIIRTQVASGSGNTGLCHLTIAG